MSREPRAALFDLDDTLYPQRQFVVSGLRAVAAHAAATWDLDQSTAVTVLQRAHAQHRGQELQRLQQRFDLPADAVPLLVDVIRMHAPVIRLPRTSRSVLARMRDGWRLAIVTNGRPDIQARKIAALGLAPLVDAVVFATATGNGEGKPAPAPFLDACRRLGVDPAQAVFVGDDPRCDVAGARRVGMKTIWLPRQPRSASSVGAGDADVTLGSLSEVPETAERLLPPTWRPHAA